MYKKILVPLDGSDLAKLALDQAEKLAKTFDAEIILFQVVPFMPIYGSPELVTPLIVDEKQKEAAEKYLATSPRNLKRRVLRWRRCEDWPASGCGDHRLCKRECCRFDRDVHPRSFWN